MKDLRRVVTGIDASGKSYVAIDGPGAGIIEESGAGLAEIWVTDTTPADNAAKGDAAKWKMRLEPPAAGSVFRFFMLAPEDKTLSARELEERTAAMFAAIGGAHCRVDTTRHPSMHTTRTVDYVILLSAASPCCSTRGRSTSSPSTWWCSAAPITDGSIAGLSRRCSPPSDRRQAALKAL